VSKVLRPDDLLARWADLEIVALFYKTDRKGATHALTRAREALASEVFRHADATFRAEFAAGLVEVVDGSSLDDAIEEANRVLLVERDADPGLTASANTPDPARRGKQTILVIDSEQEVAFRLGRKLKTFNVRHAPNERAAVSAATSGPVAIVLLDAKLSGTSTFALLRKLRQTSGLERTPILMTANLGRDPDIARAFEFGADDYILKPCSTANLVARIRRHLKRAASHPSGTGLVGKAGVIAGLFSGDQLFEFIQMLGLNLKTGRLALNSDTGTGHIDFRLGKVVAAWSSRGKVDLDATRLLLTLRGGRFEFSPTAEKTGAQKDVIASVDTLLLDAMRQRDESSLQGE
jgi:PleD family two-component response regulator